MSEILFYHLVSQPLEKALPLLLEKTVERGWNAVIRSGTEERSASHCRTETSPGNQYVSRSSRLMPRGVSSQRVPR